MCRWAKFSSRAASAGHARASPLLFFRFCGRGERAQPSLGPPLRSPLARRRRERPLPWRAARSTRTSEQSESGRPAEANGGRGGIRAAVGAPHTHSKRWCAWVGCLSRRSCAAGRGGRATAAAAASGGGGQQQRRRRRGVSSGLVRRNTHDSTHTGQEARMSEIHGRRQCWRTRALSGRRRSDAASDASASERAREADEGGERGKEHAHHAHQRVAHTRVSDAVERVCACTASVWRVWRCASRAPKERGRRSDRTPCMRSDRSICKTYPSIASKLGWWLDQAKI